MGMNMKGQNVDINIHEMSDTLWGEKIGMAYNAKEVIFDLVA